MINSALSKPPSVKWAQDKDNIWVTVSIDCSDSKQFKPTAYSFSLNCRAKGGQSSNLQFTLREAIKPAESQCKTVRGEEECKLVKLHSHYFDRLTRDADEIKTLKPDWTRWKDEEDSQSQQEDHYEGVMELAKSSIDDVDKLLSGGSVVVADISFPWCTQCGYTRKTFAGVAKRLSSDTDKVKFVVVDARENFEAVSRYNISCDYKCEFYVLHQGEEAWKVPAKSSEEEMAAALQAYLAPAVTRVASEADYAAFRERHPVHALALVESS
eukprot:CAMPEP_0113682600 /NCGR_PEP_ID=MMETSP0038_2-20120614/12770_1 /TAXON_ID=2898 /ORGANISM="Cryptomonas paramecium" /LENGTH=268 /DNA_ID=CAMNT_0000601721 /DNA_START=62 /DNA_END=865 /DNA_ORIENTATION=+ /assembly_acc=CAM_ASM_000170